MANEIRTKTLTESAFTITINSLAASSGRGSTAVTNSNNYPAAIVSVQIYTGTAPTAYTAYTVYLLRDLGTIATDSWTGSDAALTPLNAQALGTIVVTASGSTYFRGEFDTARLGPLGPTWGILVFNGTDQAADSSNNAAYYNYYVPEVQ